MKAFLIFWEKRIPEKFFILQETELSYIPGENFQARKMKKTHSQMFLIFRKMKLSLSWLKKLFIAQEDLPKPEKPKFIIPLQKNL